MYWEVACIGNVEDSTSFSYSEVLFGDKVLVYLACSPANECCSYLYTIYLFVSDSVVNRQLSILAVLAFMVYEGILLINCIHFQEAQ